MPSSNQTDSVIEQLEKSRNHDKYWNISRNIAIFLSNLVALKKPKRVLEVGTSNGYSGLWIVRSLGEGSLLYTIEVDESRFDEAKRNFEKAGVSEKIRQVKGEVFEVLEEEDFGPFDLIFIDAAHKKYAILVEALEKKGCIGKDCIVVADNILSHSYMEEFVEFMKTKCKVEVIREDSGVLVGLFDGKN